MIKLKNTNQNHVDASALKACKKVRLGVEPLFGANTAVLLGNIGVLNAQVRQVSPNFSSRKLSSARASANSKSRSAGAKRTNSWFVPRWKDAAPRAMNKFDV